MVHRGQLSFPLRYDQPERLQMYTADKSLAKVTEVLPRRSEPFSQQTIELGKAGRRHGAALDNWTHWQRHFRRQEAALSRQLHDAAPDTLVLRTCKAPAAIQDHRAENVGLASDFPQRTQKERFYQQDAFFRIAERRFRHQELVTSLTWTERKLYKPPCSVLQPDLDQEPPDARVESRPLDVLQAGGGIRDLGEPLRRLFVRGRKQSEDVDANTGDAGDGCRSPTGSPTGSASSGFFRPESGCFGSPSHSLAADAHTPEVLFVGKPCLQVEDRVYAWQQPCSEELNEVGVHGMSGVKCRTFLTLVNLGSTVIHYSWMHDFHEYFFKKKHYRCSPIAFDQADGTLLPYETARLALHFYTETPGKWSERWHLCTQPRLGPGAGVDIPVSFWFIAFSRRDPSLDARARLCRQLEHGAVVRMTAACVQQLVECLPLRKPNSPLERAADRWERGLRPDDVQLFQQRNPGMAYHSEAMQLLFQVRACLREVKGGPGAGEDLARFWESFEAVKPGRRMTKQETRRTSAVTGAPSQLSLHQAPRKMRANRPPKKYGLKRADTRLAGLHRELQALDENAGPKEQMLEMVNAQAAAMSQKREEPVNPDHKHLVCRMALARFLDDVANDKRRLRQNLRLEESARSKTAQQPPAAALDLAALLSAKESLNTPFRDNELNDIAESSEESADLDATTPPDAQLATTKDLEVSRATSEIIVNNVSNLSNNRRTRQLQQQQQQQQFLLLYDSDQYKFYRRRLYAAVFERLGMLVESLHPLLTPDFTSHPELCRVLHPQAPV